jgi:pyruvate dehydrogenase E2 component (dihydrolipoamide acetyltransferase)
VPGSGPEMAHVIRMPEVLAGATEATLQSWLVSPGQRVVAQQALAELETDKALVELPVEYDGVVGRLLVSEGDVVDVGRPIAVVLGLGEADDAADSALGEDAMPPTPPVPPTPPTPPTKARTEGRRLFASPLVRRLAAEQGIDLNDVAGSGPNGRVVRRDLARHSDALTTALAASTPTWPATVAAPTAASTTVDTDATPAFEDIPLDRMRGAIARRLTESKTTVPHFYLVAHCRVDKLIELRAQVNASTGHRLSLNDFVLKAVALAMVEVPAANAIWNGDSIRRFTSVDISVAVATDGGLVTPVLRGAERASLTALSTTMADLADRARAGRLRQHELEGGSFSVSNLGMYGTSEFTAIINPPQSGILAVGAARQMPIAGEDGQVVVGSVMTLTLSADHRVLDGAIAAQWMAALQRRIENPLTILI